jgi:hypothetical protein
VISLLYSYNTPPHTWQEILRFGDPCALTTPSGVISCSLPQCSQAMIS